MFVLLHFLYYRYCKSQKKQGIDTLLQDITQQVQRKVGNAKKKQKTTVYRQISTITRNGDCGYGSLNVL